MMHRIIIARDTATPAYAALAKEVEDKTGILRAMGHRVVRDTSRHVMEWGLSPHPNKLLAAAAPELLVRHRGQNQSRLIA